MSTDQKLNEAQQRLMQVVMLLGNDVVQGYAPGQIAKALNVPPPYITRDLVNLAAQGWATYNEHTGHWIIGHNITGIAVKGMKAIDEATRKMNELRNRYTV